MGTKDIIKNWSFAYNTLYQIKLYYRNGIDLLLWAKNGRPIPPPHVVKQITVKQYARRFNLDILIETGTFLGDIVYAMRKNFDKIYSIELSKELSDRAKERFRNYKHIHIVQGDSPIILSRLLPQICRRPLIWLDAHYSGGNTAKGDLETPIMRELNEIFRHIHLNPVILIDDARCFDGSNGYPTIEQLRSYVLNQCPGWIFEIEYDIIRIHAPCLQMLTSNNL